MLSQIWSLLENTAPHRERKCTSLLCPLAFTRAMICVWFVGLLLPWTRTSSLRCVWCTEAMTDTRGWSKPWFQFTHRPTGIQWLPESSLSIKQGCLQWLMQPVLPVTSVQKWCSPLLPICLEPVTAPGAGDDWVCKGVIPELPKGGFYLTGQGKGLKTAIL